ncbi:hypothetical protein PIB30_109751, partial [Stylosanthes scabra]|nr:hypothetical protein [Stylosanthes scabra]
MLGLNNDDDVEDSSEPSIEFSEATSDEDYIADLSTIVMVNSIPEKEEEPELTDEEGGHHPPPPPTQPTAELSQPRSGNFYFTFDDLPPYRYREMLNDFGAWIDTRMVVPGMTLSQVLSKFVTRMNGNLREWINGFSEYERRTSAEIQRMMVVLRKEIPTTTLGEIYQLALATLDKL